VGAPIVDVCRQMAITEQTFCRWKKQYLRLKIDQVWQLKKLQEDNGKLKILVAEEMRGDKSPRAWAATAENQVGHGFC
jgi:hypothetical protein